MGRTPVHSSSISRPFGAPGDEHPILVLLHLFNQLRGIAMELMRAWDRLAMGIWTLLASVFVALSEI